MFVVVVELVVLWLLFVVEVVVVVVEEFVIEYLMKIYIIKYSCSEIVGKW